MNAFIWLIDTLLDLYMWGIIISAVLSGLKYGGIINPSNRFVYLVGDFLYRITEPTLRIVRRWIPNLGGIDISPVIVILVIAFFRKLLWDNFGPY